jgi:hypothetical protein
MQMHKDQIAQVTNNADSRVRKMLDLTNKNQVNLEKTYAESLDAVKDNYVNKIGAYREKAVSDQQATNKSMSERFRGLDESLNNKLENTIKTYEDKIAQLKEEQSREMKRLENMYGQRSKDQEKATKLEKESLTMKYEAKLAQLNESHQEQLERVNRRHQEDMQNLSVKMSSYSRKA